MTFHDEYVKESDHLGVCVRIKAGGLMLRHGLPPAGSLGQSVAGITPPCRACKTDPLWGDTMYWDVKAVKPLPDYRIYIEIADGRKGTFNLKPCLDVGVFRELRDVHYFNQVVILFGAVTWPHAQDIAPETLLSEMVPLDPNLASTTAISP